MNTLFTKTLTLFALITTTLSLTNCGPSTTLPSEYKESSLKSQIEYELIPDANITVDSTEPVWHLGSNAFTPGIDRLIVITKSSSNLSTQKTAKTYNNRNPKDSRTRYDSLIERVWLTIPIDTPIGKVINIQDLGAGQINYDENKLDLTQKKFLGQFNQPFRITGSYRIAKETTQNVTVDLNLNITPAYQNAWSIRKQVIIPVIPQGKYATRSKQFIDIVTENYNKPLRSAETYTAKDILGQWQAKSENYTYNFQFNKDNTFTASVTREFKTPGVFKGTTKIIDNMLFLETTQIKFDDSKLDYVPNPLQQYTITIKDKKLTFQGQIIFRQDDLETLELTQQKYTEDFIQTQATIENPINAKLKSKEGKNKSTDDAEIIDDSDPDANLFKNDK